MNSQWTFMEIAYIILYLLRNCAACHGGAEDMKSLLNATFADYNKLVIPRRNYTRPLEVKVQLVIPFIETLDVKNQLLKFFGVLNLVWIDEFLRWDPADYGQMTNIVIPSSLIWTPNLLIVNAKNKPFDSVNDAQVANVFYDGTVMYTPTGSMEITCEKVDISKFPYDQHKCGPGISPWMYDNTTVKLVVSDESFSLYRMAPHGQFMVSPDNVDCSAYDYDGRFYETCSFPLKLVRRPIYMTLTLLLPVCLISLLEGVSLVMSPDEPEKLSISITILLSFTVFLGVINENLPETSENISLMVVYITALQLLAFFVVIGNTIVYASHHKKSRVSDISTQHRLFDETSSEKNDWTTGDNHKNAPSSVISLAERLNTRLCFISFALFVVLTAVFLIIAVFF